MKRSSGYSGEVGQSSKRSKGFDDEPSFEEELGMMDENHFELIDESDGSEPNENQESRWARPPIASGFSSQSDSLAFHWLDIDATSGSPLMVNPSGEELIGSRESSVPMLRMYGVTSVGQSVLAWVHGFTPYFFVSLPSISELSTADLGNFRVVLNQRVRCALCAFCLMTVEQIKEKARGEEKNLNEFVLGVEKTKKMQSLLGYHFNETKQFIQVRSLFLPLLLILYIGACN